MTATAMNDTHDTSVPYEVGYGKPPRRTQFRKGQSGNPGGRPRRLPVRLANALLLKEAYRGVAIKENGRIAPVTALQAILRSQVELAMNGNLRAQRYVLEEVRHLESLKAIGFYSEADFDLTDGYDETDEVGDSDEEDESDEADETFESGEADEAGEAGESDEEDETGEGGESGSDHIGTVVTAARVCRHKAAPLRPFSLLRRRLGRPRRRPRRLSIPLGRGQRRRPAAAGRQREPTRAAPGGTPSRRSPQ